MVLVIDTASARSALAVVHEGRVVAEDVAAAGAGQDLARRCAALTELTGLDGVATALGPGSFTGLRAGAAYALGLAMGLGVPLLGLDNLAVAAERSRGRALGLAEAGRGRVYFEEDGAARVGAPSEVPRERPATGWLRPETERGLREAGIRLLDESELDPFGEAAARLLGGARELGYDTVRLRYLHSFGQLRKS